MKILKNDKSGKRTKKVTDARKIIVILSNELTNESNKTISEALKISQGRNIPLLPNYVMIEEILFVILSGIEIQK